MPDLKRSELGTGCEDGGLWWRIGGHLDGKGDSVFPRAVGGSIIDEGDDTGVAKSTLGYEGSAGGWLKQGHVARRREARERDFFFFFCVSRTLSERGDHKSWEREGGREERGQGIKLVDENSWRGFFENKHCFPAHAMLLSSSTCHCFYWAT